MADSLTSAGGTNSAIVPEKWSSRYQINLRNEIVFNSIIRRDYEGEIQERGDTVRIPSIPDVTANDINEGQKNDATASTATTDSLIINTETAVDFLITNRAKLQSIEFIDELEERAVNAIMQKMQTNIINLIVPSAASPDHQIAYDSGTTLADADLLEALDLEEDANWDQTGRVIVTGGRQKNDVIAITKFADKDTNLGSSPSSSGMITEPIYSHTFMWTNAVSTTTYLFTPDFMQMAVQDGLNMNLKESTDGSRTFRLEVDVLYGIKQIHDDRVISIS